MRVYKISSELVTNCDNLYVFQQNGKNIIFYCDMQLIFDDSEIEEACQRLLLYDPILSRLTKEDLLEMLKKVKTEENKQ